MDTSSSREESHVEEIEEPTATPLWAYVTKVSNEASGSKGGGGSGKFICNFGCKTEPYMGSYTRVRAHLIGILPGQKPQGISLCSALTKDDRELLKNEELEAQRMFAGNAKARRIPKPTAHQSSLLFDSTSSPKGSLDKMFHTSNRDEVEQKIARCLYVNGIPFHVLRSPFWAEMVSAINTAHKGYKAPSYEKARTTLLDREQSKVKQALIPLMEDWNTHGVSIISDGWSNVKNQSLINVMAVSGGKAMFVSAHDVSAIEKNGQNITDILLKAIEDVGPSNVVQVITDNASNYKAAGAIIQQQHKHIFWSGCLAHTLNLLMKDIAKSSHPSLCFVNETYKRAKAVVKYIKNHTACQSLFKTFSSLDLLKAKKTRFGHHYIVVSRLVEVRAALISMAVTKQWDNLKKSAYARDHDEVHKTIMDDNFWRSARKILRITKPLYTMLRFSDSDKAVIGEVYEQMDTTLGILRDILINEPVVHDVIHNLVVDRWDKMNIPLHCLAYILVTKYYTQAWLCKPAPGGVTRRKPNFDQEVQKGYLEAIDKMISDLGEASLIRQQISDFVSNKGVFAQPQTVIDRGTMSSLQWWHLFGGIALELYSLAVKVLSQNVNSSCAERYWSTYSYIHNVKRNRLNANRAEKLVFVHYNQRLLTRYREDYEMTYKNWDKYAEDDNIEDDITTIEAQDGALDSLVEDDDLLDDITIPTPASPLSPLVQRQTLITSSTSMPTSSPPASSSRESPTDQARKRLEKARGKRQRK